MILIYNKLQFHNYCYLGNEIVQHVCIRVNKVIKRHLNWLDLVFAIIQIYVGNCLLLIIIRRL